MDAHKSCRHDLFECNDEGFARPNTSAVTYDMRDAIVDAAIDVDTARRSVYHLTEECDAYRVVAEYRGRYLCLVNVAISPAGMDEVETTGLNAWATVVYDALAGAEAAGLSADEVLEMAAQWRRDHHPADDPYLARGDR